MPIQSDPSTPFQATKKFLRRREARDEYGLAESTSKKLMREGKLLSYHVGRSVYLSRDDIERFFAERAIRRGNPVCK